MNIRLINIGKTTVPYLIDGELDYMRRLQHYLKFERLDLKESKSVKNQSKEVLKKEAELILKQLNPKDIVVLLDEKGKEMGSEHFSVWLEKKQMIGPKQIIFITGGAYGFDETVYRRADEIISISKMTFSHQMIRLLFWSSFIEQKQFSMGRNIITHKYNLYGK